MTAAEPERCAFERMVGSHADMTGDGQATCCDGGAVEPDGDGGLRLLPWTERRLIDLLRRRWLLLGVAEACVGACVGAVIAVRWLSGRASVERARRWPA